MKVYDLASTYQGGFTATRSATRYLAFHHAAATYAPGTAVKAINKFHTDKPPKGNGWSGVGYHEILFVDTDDAIACAIVSDPLSVRAHVAYRNHEAFGLCAAANFETTPAERWLNAAAERLRYHLQRWPDAQIVGHQDLAVPGHGTRCPGPTWWQWKTQLLAAVSADPVERYRVKWDNTYVREAPTLTAPIAWGGTCLLPAGMVLEIGDVVHGEAFRGDDRWAHWPAAGFIWYPQLEKVS